MRQVGMLLLGLAMLCYFSGSAIGEPITDPSQLSPNPTIIDFEALSNFTNPLIVGDVTFTSVTASLSLLDVNTPNWPVAGEEVAGLTLFPGGEPDSAILITFANPVSEVLVGWGDPNFSDNFLRAYDAGGNLLEEVAVPYGPINGVFATWIGFKRPVADITNVLVQPHSNDDYVIDNIHYNVNVAPGPVYKYFFTGTAKAGSTLDGSGSGLGSLSVNTGDPVSGFFLVDTNLNDVDPDPAHAQYRHFFMAGVTIFINGSRLEISDYIVKVSDDYIGTMADLFEVQNFGVVTLDGVPIFLTAGELDFTGAPVDTFSGFAVPDPSIITNWPGNVDLGLMGDTSLHHVTFSINTVRLASPIDIDIKSAIVWTGLKNSDDQGTRFDLRAALYINDALVAEGQTLCVTGITRNPSNAKEVMVPFGPISTNELASGDVVSLKVFTRIGSNPDGSKCPGHSNAVGLRLYYDSPTRPSGFGAEISPAPMTDYFLHSGGGDYFLDKVSPTGPVKYKDSSGVNYKNGNPWKEIGTWSMTLP